MDALASIRDDFTVTSRRQTQQIADLHATIADLEAAHSESEMAHHAASLHNARLRADLARLESISSSVSSATTSGPGPLSMLRKRVSERESAVRRLQAEADACAAATGERRARTVEDASAVATEVGLLARAAVQLRAPPDSVPPPPPVVACTTAGGTATFRPSAVAIATVAAELREALDLPPPRTAAAAALAEECAARDVLVRDLDAKIAYLQRRVLNMIAHSEDDLACLRSLAVTATAPTHMRTASTGIGGGSLAAGGGAYSHMTGGGGYESATPRDRTSSVAAVAARRVGATASMGAGGLYHGGGGVGAQRASATPRGGMGGGPYGSPHGGPPVGPYTAVSNSLPTVPQLPQGGQQRANALQVQEASERARGLAAERAQRRAISMAAGVEV